MSHYSLERVSELHISGGSWSEYTNKTSVSRIRRDTHDEKVPVEVLDLLPLVLARCPNLRYVIFERLAETIKGAEDAEEFRKDYIKIKETVNQHACGRV